MSDKKDRKKVLGRGLGALLESPETDITAKDISGNFVAGAIAEIKIDQIEINPFQPREDFDETELKELSQSIKEQGIIQPVTTRKLGFDKYQLISGERRLRASKLAGMETIPSYIRIANDQQMLEMALVENIQRSDLNAIEVSIAYKRLIEECKINQEELSNIVGKNRSTISNYLRLLKLPAEIQVAIRDNKISMGHAKALLAVDNPEKQLDILNLILAENLSVRAIEKMVKEDAPIAKAQPVAKEKTALPEKYHTAINQISEAYQSKIQVKRNNKGKGSIVIPFKSDDDLDRIIDMLSE
jgi:ParB family chromosome partitioning protein